MTLVELMVAIGVTLIVMALTVSIFMAQYKSSVKRSDANKIQESTPPVVELLKRDLMLAGWSVRSDMAFFFEDGGANGSDRIYVNDSTIIDEQHTSEVSKFMQLECSGCMRTQTLNHFVRVDGDSETAKLDIDDEEEDDDTTGKDFVKSVYQFIITSSSSQRVARLGNILFEAWYGLPVLYDTADTPNLVVFNSGTFVAPAIYYCVDDGSATQCHPPNAPADPADPPPRYLRRSDRNSGLDEEANGRLVSVDSRQVIAENVVDLQVAYRDKDSGTWYGAEGCADRGDCAPATFSSGNIDLIRFTLVTRSSRYRDKALINNAKYCRPAAENRASAAAGSSECGYTYRRYTVQVKPRNN
jgi:hypothetical protein